MNAIVMENYGPPEVLKLRQIAKPEPKSNEVRVRVHATSVGYGDLLARNFRDVTPSKMNMPMLFWLAAKFSFGWQKPNMTILGAEFAGEIDAVGSAVTTYKPGERVFGYLGQAMGGYAEYLCMPENGALAHMPENLTYEQASILAYGGIMGINLIKLAGIQAGDRVLIYGASGGIGWVAVQLAKAAGAHVTGVCGTNRMDFVKSLGADEVIDYTKEDVTRRNEKYAVIIDILGKGSFSRARRILTADGRYLNVSFKLKQLLQMAWTGLFSRQKVICVMLPENGADLWTVKQLAEAGELAVPVERSFPMGQAAEAHRYVESGNRRGNVVITIQSSNGKG